MDCGAFFCNFVFSGFLRLVVLHAMFGKSFKLCALSRLDIPILAIKMVLLAFGCTFFQFSSVKQLPKN